MPVNEASARAVIQAELLAINYGGALTPAATAVIQNLAEAFAKCISHYASNNTVATDITGAVTGATPGPPPTVGVFNGTGTGTGAIKGILGLIKGDALTGVGLAGEIMAVLEVADLGGTLTATARAQLALIADAVAIFADYVNGNSLVSTTDSGAGTVPGFNGAATGTGTGSAV